MSRNLPQNLDTERAILGIILAQNDALFDVSHLITKADFFEPMHGEIFTLLRDMIETGRVATPSTVLYDMSQDADIGGITAGAYLEQILRDAPHATLAKDFACTVRDLAMRRRLITVAEQHIDECFNAPATITAQEMEARYSAANSTLFATVQEAGMSPLGDIAMDLLKDTQKALQGDRRRGIGTGLKALDDLVGPLLGGRLLSLSGASGSGKTALAWQIAKYAADVDASEGAVLFESLEMDGAELATRDLTYMTGIPSERIERADLTESEFEQLVEAQMLQKKSNIIVDSRKSQTVGGIRGKAMRVKRLRGLKLLVIDHLRYLKPSGKSKELFDQQSEDLQAINAIADDLQVPVILLCQLKASYGSEKDIREPNVGDIFNGAVLEQESDILLLVHREEYMLARRKPAEGSKIAEWSSAMQKSKGRAKLLLNKRRGGAGYGTRTIGFDAPTTRFTDEVPKVDFMDPVIV